ncbi:beta-glucosidase [Parabacteroides sp. PF5-5]|uniref:xylan 1,4-beta-xylosidase n=1 Tax=unclassified Parabacteroides TaxID=2649774 RepID=UPI002475748C|nr:MULTISPECIES: xylan 1,4-beta-xylosidase [unclassified Parabacteroides]MDH6304336.1 beta-glucosidase [Parabacteroides sp. PH5-39]MDH6315511.1 beta-glucosidase [Parabacteroides sp. PF5-13]MDH6318995.1 beta-glucosidase [Parabacteroides sp. PH5-13]MDH6322724.1 beta-glucosidase [Parabacteroides sp. PH5-8]MDH6326704.1 beta-glucosidase [Parabacteroides sp. PH5-41]
MRMKYLSFISTCIVCLATACSSKQYEYPFRNPNLPLEERMEDLLGRLTLEEKVGQMMNQTPAIERLGIPEYDWWNEALHGVARAGQATVFPQSIAMAATFDDEALHKTFDMISDEARAKYHQYQKDKEYDRYKGLTFWTPNINIFRDPRWGRGMETYGEDPYLTGRMGVAVVKGLQGNDPKYFKTHACAKHYAVHSGPEWNRHEYNAEATPRDLWTTYLPAFEELVKEADVQEVMCAYNRFEGTPCCSSDKLLIDILRNTWGYEDIILSDCGAIDDFWRKDPRTPRHETHPSAEAASADAVKNGTDLECGGSYQALLKAVQDGLITEEELNVSLRRLFKGRFELGMFDPDELVPYASIPYSVVESPEHVAQSLDMARKSMVLLKNKNNILPLSKSLKKIAVVGPNANDSIMLWANYNGFPSKTVTILEGIKNKVPDAEVIYELGCNHTDNFVITDFGNHIFSSAGIGFASEFYNNRDFEGEPVHKGIASGSSIHYTTGGNTQFAPNVNLTNFSARFTGEFESPISGPVEFTISGNDGYRLFIGDEKVIDIWDREYTSGQQYILHAEKGKKYPVKIEYMQRIGNADLNFQIGVRTPVDYQATAAKVKEADIIVYVGGISPRLEGEEMPVDAEGFRKGDRTNIEVPNVQKEMIRALKATGKPVVYVVCTGSALALNWEEANLDAILNAWYGGQEAGTAVADILFGDYNPAGRLPITFYKSVDQLADFQDYNMKGRTYRYMTETPLYPFGYGLSYTTFEYKNAKLSQDKISKTQSVTLTLDIANTGKADGDEVAQVYIKNPNDPEGPIKALKAFKRVHVNAGSSQQLSIELQPKAFWSFNDPKQIMEVRSGKYQILYGGSSADKALQSIDLTVE